MSSPPHPTRRTVLRGAVAAGIGTAVGGSMLSTTSTAHTRVPTPDIAGCQDWGARPDTGLTQLSNSPNKIVVHHTASANSTDLSREHAWDLAYTIQGWHMNENGWADSGQHFTISRGGHIMEGRHTSLQHLTDGAGFVQGAHAPGANTDGIGIENEGTYISELPTQQLWDSLVAFCAYACQQYGIAATEIYGHRDFVATACPGDAFYAKLPELRAAVQAALDGGTDPVWSVVVDNADADFTAGEGWGVSSWSSQKNGPDYMFAEPGDSDGVATFWVDVPVAGQYTVETWYPADPGYNPTTTFTVHSADAPADVVVDQTANGGQWVSLGSHYLDAGRQDLVTVGRGSSWPGYVIADAIRVTAVG